MTVTWIDIQLRIFMQCFRDKAVELLSCPNTGCDELVRKSNLDKHLLECEFSSVMCKLCSKDIILKDKEVSFTPDVLLINTLLCRECVSSS